MYKFFENIELSNRIAIIISIMTFLYAIIKDYIKGKRYKQVEKRNEEYSNWKKEFENYKDKVKQNDASIKRLLFAQNTRASVIPYFNIVLKDNRIKQEGNSLILGVGFMNIGKESAVNIQLLPEFPDKGLKGYFDSGVTPKRWDYIFGSKMPSKRQYCINEYLSQNYAMSKEEVTFKIKGELTDGEEIIDFIKFKINYSDLMGNEYVQEFEFGFQMADHRIRYSQKNTSYKPELLKD